MDSFLIGIDLGTTRCKSIVFDKDLNIAGEAYAEYNLINNSDIEIEQDANEWWDLTVKVVKDSIERSKADRRIIRGISISSQGIAFVPVDKDCNPVRNAISWLDTRAGREARLILSEYNEFDIFKKTGKRINGVYTLPKLIWLKNNEPEIYDKTYKFLMPHDFIAAKLTGKYVTDHTMASGTMAFDINKGIWWNEIISKFGLDIDKFPDIKYSGRPAGRLKEAAADIMGLDKNVIVSAGGQDQKCAALGAGINDKTVTVSLGTAAAIEKISDTPFLKNNMKIPVFSYLFKNQWIMEGVIGTAGVSLKWFKNTLFNDTSYKELDKMAEKTEKKPGSVFFYPFLNGAGSPNWYNDAKGCFFGISLSTSKEELIKSVMEGIAYQIKSNIDVIGEGSGNIEEIRVFGGGSESDIWCRIISNITGKRVRTIYTSETACIGAAVLAGLGAGVFNDLDDVYGKINIKKTYIPDKELKKEYRKKYKEYIKYQEKIMP